MTDENTADLTTDELLRMILARLDRLEAQAQAQAEERANTTRPLLDRAIAEMIQTREMLTEHLAQVGERLAVVERETRIIRREIGLLREDIRNERMERVELAERVSAIEQRPN
jgi:hypothetical protein